MIEFNDPDALVEWFDDQLYTARTSDHPFIDAEDLEKVFDMVLREIPVTYDALPIINNAARRRNA